ncbi:Ctr copper transporter [Paraphoma chrysanthemicola]|nr:Ctr copper transporter [Paraphoma chrysanthemicola]
MNMATPSLGTPSAGPISTMKSMPGMSSTFSASTRVTLWFTDWTTTSAATYFLTILFLFCLGMMNRFLGALKIQLERKWKAERIFGRSTASSDGTEKPSDHSLRGHARQWSRALRPQPVRLEEPQGQETEPLSPAVRTTHSDEEDTKPRLGRSRRLLVPNAPWSLKRDGISAALEFIRALLGYILMLAVMSYNVGFLFAVTGSVLLGELVFGRYSRGSMSLAEDACHS